MRKAFRAATVFTGAAVGATLLAPALAANAATTDATTEPPTGLVPDVLANCPRGSNTSVHLYWSPGERHGPTCVGNVEYYTAFGPNVTYVSLCAGNNSGVFSSSNGFFVYHHGYHLGLHNGHAQKIDNETWSGNSKCAY